MAEKAGMGYPCTKSETKYPAEGAKVRKNGGNTPIQAGRATKGPSVQTKPGSGTERHGQS